MQENKSKNKNTNVSSGFTILGTLFSAFLVVISIVAIATLTSQIYGSSRNSRNRFIAVGLAKEGIELVRNMRDGNWLHYPETVGETVTAMQWRGDGTTFSCATDESCLRSLCNRSGTDYYTVDALSSDLGLVQNGSAELKIDSNGYYTHGSGTATTPSFSRKIKIITEDTSGLPGSGDCGEIAQSSSSDPSAPFLKPNPIMIQSIVSWEEPVGVPHSVLLQERLYDWITKRP